VTNPVRLPSIYCVSDIPLPFGSLFVWVSVFRMMRRATGGFLVKRQLHIGTNAFTVITWSETYVVGTWTMGGGNLNPLTSPFFPLKQD
jgi:hypothetical protein